MASAALIQKDDESQLLYDIIRLYEEIIAGLMKDRPEPPASLKPQFLYLQELKTTLDIFKIDERSNERMRRKIQLSTLGDRIFQASQEKDTATKMSNSPILPPKNKPHSTSSKTNSKPAPVTTKKQNIFSSGLAKLLGKTSEKNMTRQIEAVEFEKDAPNADYEDQEANIQAYNVNIIEQIPIEKVIQESLISETRKSTRSKECVEKIEPECQADIESNEVQDGVPLAKSQFSKSLMMLERQVESLNSTNSKAANIDYLAEFKLRSQERVSKLYLETPNSDRTLTTSNSSLLSQDTNQAKHLSNTSLHQKAGTFQKTQPMPKTESERKVEEKRLKEARNAAMQQVYGITTDGHSKIHPVLHKATDRSKRNTTNVKNG